MSLQLLNCASSSSARMAASVSSRRTCCSSPNTTTTPQLNRRRHHHHHHHHLSISRTAYSDSIITTTTTPASPGSIRLRSIKEGYRNQHHGTLALTSSSSRCVSTLPLTTPAAAATVGQPNDDTAGQGQRFWEVVLSGLVAVAASATLVVAMPSSSSSSSPSSLAGHATSPGGVSSHQQKQQLEHAGIISGKTSTRDDGDFPTFASFTASGQQSASGGQEEEGSAGDGEENSLSGGGNSNNRRGSFFDVAYASLLFADEQQQQPQPPPRPYEHRDDMHPRGPENNDNNNNNHQDDSSSSSASTTVSDGRRRRKNYDISVRAIKGGRVTMEDEYFVSKGGRFAAVFDGHGGGGVSQLLRNKLYEWVVLYLKQKHWEDDSSMTDPTNAAATTSATSPATGISTDSSMAANNMDIDSGISDKVPSISSYVAALRMAFSRAEADVLEKDALKYQGSTAVAVLLHESQDEGSSDSGSGSRGPGNQRTLVSANVGDSRAILSRRGRAIDLTRDHKPNEEREKARILAMGETIEWDSFSKVHRVRNLSLSRAIGDRYAKPAVSGQVEIKIFPVAEVDDEFFLLASDGLWDVMSSQDVVNYVHQRFDAELKRVPEMSKEDKENYKLVLRRNMARSVAREAYRRGSGDNICVLMVWLKDFSPSS